MKPLPPKTAIRGGVAAVAAQRASMVRSAGCDPGDPDNERIPTPRRASTLDTGDENKEPIFFNVLRVVRVIRGKPGAA